MLHHNNGETVVKNNDVFAVILKRADSENSSQCIVIKVDLIWFDLFYLKKGVSLIQG